MFNQGGMNWDGPILVVKDIIDEHTESCKFFFVHLKGFRVALQKNFVPLLHYIGDSRD